MYGTLVVVSIGVTWHVESRGTTGYACNQTWECCLAVKGWVDRILSETSALLTSEEGSLQFCPTAAL